MTQNKPEGIYYDIVQYASNANLLKVTSNTEAIQLFEKTTSDPKVDNIETIEKITYKYYIRTNSDTLPWDSKILFVILRKSVPIEALSDIDYLLSKTNLLYSDVVVPLAEPQLFEGDVHMNNMWLSKGDKVYMVFQSFKQPPNPSAAKIFFNGVFKIKKTE